MRAADKAVAIGCAIATAFLIGLLSGEARAEVIGDMPNRDGGMIELHDVECPAGDRVGLIARTWTQSQPDQYGCWTANTNTGTVTIHWIHTGRDHTYRLSDFTRRAVAPSRTKSSNNKEGWM